MDGPSASPCAILAYSYWAVGDDWHFFGPAIPLIVGVGELAQECDDASLLASGMVIASTSDDDVESLVRVSVKWGQDQFGEERVPRAAL